MQLQCLSRNLADPQCRSWKEPIELAARYSLVWRESSPCAQWGSCGREGGDWGSCGQEGGVGCSWWLLVGKEEESGFLVGSPQLPPYLVPTNQSERYLSEPIKATGRPVAPQSAPILCRGCCSRLRGFNPKSGSKSSHGHLSGQEAQIRARSTASHG